MTHVRASSWIPIVLFCLGPVARARSTPQDELAARACAACHSDLASAGLREAPDLRLSATRIEAAFMESFLADPHGVQEGTRMPDLMGGLAPEERKEAARALAAFLRSEAAPDAVPEPAATEASPERGQAIYHRVGCVMCHGARVPGEGAAEVPPLRPGMRALDHVPQKYTTSGLAAFLLEPLAHRPAGLMPDMQLSRTEAADLAAYLAPPAPAAAAKAPEDARRVAEGARQFLALGCVSCHGGVIQLQGMPLERPILNVAGGCLSEAPPAGVPDYRLGPLDRDAIRAEIAALGADRSPDQIIDQSLGAFRCTACHERNGEGGVHLELDAYLTTTERDLGDPARRPPQLTGVGGKLRPTWLERVLFDGASVRPYMGTRMPIFGEGNVAHLPALFAEVDKMPELTFPKPKGDEKREIHDAAREMLGTTSLGCVTCHTFNAKPAPTFQGLDLVTTPDRLQERWFREFLIDPKSLVPGIVMPDSWPGGVAIHDTMLGGDTDRQIAAIWDYLTLGRSARDPKGISQPRWDVDVADRPRVYRGRSRVAGFRGIAVGFPEGIHYAFDANNGALAAIWRGDFVSVNWNGQGAGDFNPRARAVELARDVALLRRIEDAPWPLRPTMTKEKPINPDPTYPRQHGYRFRGYHLAPDGTPTLRYALEGAKVEDCLTPRDSEGRLSLVRELRIDAPAAMDASFRMLTGDIEVLEPGRYRAGGVIVTAPGLALRMRPLGDGQELLLDLELPEGRTQLELTYELVD